MKISTPVDQLMSEIRDLLMVCDADTYDNVREVSRDSEPFKAFETVVDRLREPIENRT